MDSGSPSVTHGPGGETMPAFVHKIISQSKVTIVILHSNVGPGQLSASAHLEGDKKKVDKRFTSYHKND